MSNSVEDEIVSMKFDTRDFLKGSAQVLSAIAKLKSDLKFDGASRGLDQVQQGVNRFSTNRMQGALSQATHSWHVMQIVAGTVIATLTHQALIAGEHIVGSFFEPIKAGFSNYEQQINAVQTILANTQAAGTNLKDVTGALNDLNKYANLTIYNFSEMARNIGTFTAAGVDLQSSVNAIKGIANLAALSGSNSQQASTAMYQLSQAIAAGQVHLQDWNSVVNAGMGGTVFQRALAQTAVAMGTLKDHSLKLVGPMKNVSIAGESFRQSLQTKPGEKSWLTSKVLTNTLAQFTGDLTNAQLKAQGFNDAQIKAIQAQAKTAENAATQIKTVSQLTQALKEEVASAWAGVFKTLLGNINQAKQILTPLHNTLQNLFTGPVNGLNKLLEGWSKLGGRGLAIQGIKRGFEDLMRFLKPIRQAFRDIFPPETAKGLYNLTKQFDHFMKILRPSKQTVENLRRTFRGVFAVVDIFVQIIKGAIGLIGSFFGSVGKGSGSFLNFTGNIGDTLVAFDQFLKKSGYITKFFDGLGKILSIPIHFLGAIATLIASIFDGFSQSEADHVSASFDTMGKRLSPLEKIIGAVVYAFEYLGKQMAPIGHKIGQALGDVGNAIAQGLSNGDFSAVFDVINAGLLTGIVLLIRKFFKTGFKLNLGQGGLISAIKAPFEQLTSNLKAMETQVKAKTLLEIAAAIGIITSAVVALSLINSKNLTKALTAMSVGFAELLGAMAILTKIQGSKGFIQTPIIAASLVLLATAILVLTTAVALMGQLKWETIGKGLAGIAGVLIVIGGAMRLMPKGMVLQAAALDLIAGAVTVLAAGVAAFGLIPYKNMIRGLIGLAGALAAIALGIALMPPSMVLQAVGLAIISKALVLMAAAIAGLGLLSWEQIAKGLVAIAGGLAIIAGALYLMSGTLAGAAALIVAAGALDLLTPVLFTLGHMSWGSILKGLVALAAALAIIGIAGLLLTPVIPALLGLGVAIALVGAGMTLFGAGALALATAISIIVAAAGAGIGVISGLISLLPSFMSALAEGIIKFVETIGRNLTDLVGVGVKLIVAILDGMIKIMPKVGKTITVFIHTVLKVLRKNGPDMFNTGLYLLLQFLKALNKNLPKLIDVGVSILVNLIKGIGRGAAKLANAAFDTIIKFINALTKSVNKNEPRLITAGSNLGWAIIHGLLNALGNGAKWVWDKMKSIASGAIDKAKGVFHIGSPSKVFHEIGRNVIDGLVNGLDKNADRVNTSVEKVGNNTIDTMRMAIKKASQVAIDGNLDVSPRITPVLDLTRLANDASKIGTTLGKHRIHANVSARAASDLADHIQANNNGTDDRHEKQAPTFNQYNYSPKAIGPAETYRNTKSQFALAKEVLGL